ncbi:glycosyltransferase family 8 protein [Lacticaseibacillus rhamnosus]|uniref:glycosyltransferase family 8 protein n=1 Tax=Lacticaseibacillus rhamnosus TaxID=47715 RepID=UPI00237FAA91|nr:glycosyltransferase family 8 protein [Lacticaseibacillus rhamnosus]MDE3296053.1 glycosyltransferase family 8 protein [Lacticaseibacillus rhamnosus]
MTMNILFCGDANMTDGVLLATLSLMRQTREPLHIFVLTATLTVNDHRYKPFPVATAAKMTELMQKENPAHQFTRIDITNLFEANPPRANLTTMFTPYCMLRLYADLVPQLPDRMLYLDTDVICRRPFAAFYHESMTGVDIAGALDHYGKWWFHHRLMWFDYLNSGVLLMNLARIRADGLLARCRQLLQQRWLFMPDQSALNKLAKCKRILPPKYNEQHKLEPDTVFQHFTTSFRFWPRFRIVTVKPWQIHAVHQQLGLHEYDDLLKDYRRLAPKLKEVS